MSDRRSAEEAAIERVRAAVDGIQAALVRYWEAQRTPQANGALVALGSAQQEFKAARKEMNSLVEDIRMGRT
ncbi:MAG: hypothetical protein ACR2QQ_00770 [Gammaproteobacteria bacterium]